MNAQSCRKKSSEITHYIVDYELDLLVITESWLFSYDNHIIGKLKPEGYDLIHLSRDNRQGGGVAVVQRKGIAVELKKKAISRSMEFMDIVCTSNNKLMRLLAVYRPTPSEKNKTPLSVFYEEFANLLDDCIIAAEELLVVGDFNFHVNVPTSSEASRFLELLDSFTWCNM